VARLVIGSKIISIDLTKITGDPRLPPRSARRLTYDFGIYVLLLFAPSSPRQVIRRQQGPRDYSKGVD